MTVRLFDTARRQVVDFEVGPVVRMYVCGITPYDSTHLGHAATYLAYDLLARRLEELGHEVRMVRNVTDVDDSILPRARQLGIPYLELAEAELSRFWSDMDALGMRPPVAEPRATEAVPGMIEMISELLDSGHAYLTHGTVYFDVSTFPRFGELSHYSRDHMLRLAAARGGRPEDPHRRDPLDFILWQPSLAGEPAWRAPFGVGRPGWHIECSVMATASLGTPLDLHGGGTDLIFPHHECEQAQNDCLAGGTSVGLWVHTAPVAYHGEKMSKSLGNIVLARDLLKAADPRAIRLAVLRRYHHRHGCEWRDEDLYAGVQLLTKLLVAVRRPSGPDPRPFAQAVRERLDDDLDVPGAVRQIERLTDATLEDGGSSRETGAVLAELAGLVGVSLAAE